MDELMDLIVTDESPSQISDKIKDILFSRSADKVQGIRPNVAASIFDSDVNLDNESDKTDELSGEVDLDSSDTE